MSLDLAIAQFDGEGAAVQRYADAKDRSSGAGAAWTRQVGFVEHHHSGRLLLRGTFAGHYLDVDENDRVSQRGAGEGAVAGGLAGVLLGPAGIALGLVIGGAVGAHAGSVSDKEPEPQMLADQLRAMVPKSSSAVVLIGSPSEVDEMVAALSESAQGMTRKSLTAEQAAALEASLSTAPPASPQR